MVERVPEGYKKTEVGVIPEDWEVVTLEETADKNVKWSITGGPFGSNLKTTDYTNDGVQVIQLQNIGDGIFKNNSQIFTSQEKANQLLSCNIYAGDIIISKMGDPVARACVIPNTAKRFLMASDGIRLAIDKKRFSNQYVLEYINANNFRKRAESQGIGSTRMRIGLPVLKSLMIPCPPPPEQTAIAEVLSDMDSLISSLKKLIAKKQSIKQGAMQQLLTGKKRLSGFSCDWVMRSIEDLTISISSGVTKEKYNTGQYIVYGSTGIIGYSNSYDYEGINILVARVGANAGAINIVSGEYSVSDNTLIINCKDNVEKNFLCCKLINFGLNRLVFGSGQPLITGKQLKQLMIYIPSTLEEQTAIAQILSDMDSEIEKLTAKLNKYKAIKQGMMQELLTGKRRLV